MFGSNCDYQVVKKIVESGDSKIFDKWKEKVPTLTKEEFLSELEWLYSDPRDEIGRMTRELGLKETGIVRLKRVYREGFCTILQDNGKLWEGAFFTQKLNDVQAKMYGETVARFVFKIQLSPEDHI